MIETEEAKHIPLDGVETYQTAGTITQISYFITTQTLPLLLPVAMAEGAYAKPDQKSAWQIQD